jgi:AraC-like DNA-binding protein
MLKESQPSDSVKPLLQTLRDNVLVWAEQRGMSRTVIARPGERDVVGVQKNLPVGIQTTRKKLQGHRLSQKGPRNYGNRSPNTGYWPEDGLREKRYSSLVCVVKGKTDFQVGDLLLHCQEGDFIFVLAGTPHPDGSRPHLEGPGKENGNCSLLWLAPAIGNGLGCWICHSRGKEHYEKPAESCYLLNEQVVVLFNILMEESVQEHPRQQAICNNLLIALMSKICNQLEEGNFYQFSRQMGESASALEDNPVQRAQSYIHSQLHKRLTIDEVAQHVYMSRAQFTKVFRRESGKSFVEYVTECRVNEAKSLLSNSEWSIATICKVIGLTPSQFRAIFSRCTGLAPAEYRRRFQGASSVNGKQADSGAK